MVTNIFKIPVVLYVPMIYYGTAVQSNTMHKDALQPIVALKCKEHECTMHLV